MSDQDTRHRYRPVDPAIWNDRRIHALSPMPCSPMGLFLFLMTCGEGGFIPGVVPLGVAAAAEILGWDPEKTRAALDELCQAGLVKADTRARLIYIVGAIRRYPPANQNIVTGWGRTWHEIMDCLLKEEIRLELHAVSKERGREFETAFLRACPCGPANGSGNGSGNKDKDQEKDSEKETDKDKDSLSVPGPVCPPPGGDPVRGNGSGQGPGASVCLPPGDALGPTSSGASGPVPGTANPPRQVVRVPDPRWDETIDDVEARELNLQSSQAPASTPVATEEAPVSPIPIPPAVQRVIDGWHTRVVAKAPDIFPRYEEEEAQAKLSEAVQAMEHPRSQHGFEVIFEACPRLPFLRGSNPRGFIANLGHYITKFADGDFECVKVAEEQLWRLFKIQVKDSTPKSKAEAEEAKARQRQSTTPPPPVCNNLTDRLKAREN